MITVSLLSPRTPTVTTTARPKSTKPPKPTAPKTTSTELAPPEPVAVSITKFEALEHRIAIATQEAITEFPYHTPEGNKAARSYLYGLRKLRGDVGRAHKEAKAGILELGRKLDSQKNTLTGAVEALIKPHQEELDAIEQAEAERIAEHEQVITEIREAGAEACRTGDNLVYIETSDAAKEACARLRARWAEIGTLDLSGMEEYRGEALAARTLAIDQFSQTVLLLENLHSELLVKEAEAKAEAERKQAERDEEIRVAAAEAARREVEAEAAAKIAAVQAEAAEAVAAAHRTAHRPSGHRVGYRPPPEAAPAPPPPSATPEALAATMEALEAHLVTQLAIEISRLLTIGKSSRVIARRLVTGKLHDAVHIDWGAVTLPRQE